jgi:hypothetical protein
MKKNKNIYYLVTQLEEYQSGAKELKGKKPVITGLR